MSITRRLIGILLAVSGLFCWLRAMEFSGLLLDLPREYRLQFSEAKPVSPTAEDLLEEEAMHYALARESTETSVLLHVS